MNKNQLSSFDDHSLNFMISEKQCIQFSIKSVAQYDSENLKKNKCGLSALQMIYEKLSSPSKHSLFSIT